MRWYVFVVFAAILACAYPWISATIDTTSYSTNVLGIIHESVGKRPPAKGIAEMVEDYAARRGLTAHARVKVGDPHKQYPDGPDDEVNRTQDVEVAVEVERPMVFGIMKRTHFTYHLQLGGSGTANEWPE